MSTVYTPLNFDTTITWYQITNTINTNSGTVQRSVSGTITQLCSFQRDDYTDTQEGNMNNRDNTVRVYLREWPSMLSLKWNNTMATIEGQKFELVSVINVANKNRLWKVVLRRVKKDV